MSLDHFIPEVWAAEVIRGLENELVAKRIANTNYQGEISGYGDTVKINGIGAVTVSSYTKNSTSITYQDLQDSQTILKIDQAKYFAFGIDDVDKAQQNPKVMQAAMAEATYQLADTLDAYVLGLVTNAGIKNSTLGTTSTPIEITADGGAGTKASTYMSYISRYMSDNKVPKAMRYVVLPPWFIQKLLIEKVINTSGSVDANLQYTNGFVDKVYGIDIYESNNTKVTSSTKYHILAGTPMSISMAEQITSMEAIRRESQFEDALRGLHVYGAKVVRADATLEGVVTEGAEGQ